MILLHTAASVCDLAADDSVAGLVNVSKRERDALRTSAKTLNRLAADMETGHV